MLFVLLFLMSYDCVSRDDDCTASSIIVESTLAYGTTDEEYAKTFENVFDAVKASRGSDVICLEDGIYELDKTLHISKGVILKLATNNGANNMRLCASHSPLLSFSKAARGIEVQNLTLVLNQRHLPPLNRRPSRKNNKTGTSRVFIIHYHSLCLKTLLLL